jgi:hypothetical protein
VLQAGTSGETNLMLFLRSYPDVLEMRGRVEARPCRALQKCTGFFRPGRLKIGIAAREKYPPNCVAVYLASDLVYGAIASVVAIAPDAETIRRQRLRGGRGTTVSPRSTTGEEAASEFYP